MGIFIGKHNRSSSWIGRFDPKNPQEQILHYPLLEHLERADAKRSFGAGAIRGG